MGYSIARLQLSDYHAKRERFAQQNGNGKKRGIGFATFMHGAGFTGSGEVYLQSMVSAEATAEGKVRIFAASTEIGQGTNTIFSQIAAEALGLDFESIEIVQPDTGLVPNSGPTVASRTSMVVGKLVESAVTGLKQTLIGSGVVKLKVLARNGFYGCLRKIHCEIWSAENVSDLPTATQRSLGR